jgi:hypothetical protein
VDCSFLLSGVVGGVVYLLLQPRASSERTSVIPARPAFEDEAVEAEAGGLEGAAPQ